MAMDFLKNLYSLRSEGKYTLEKIQKVYERLGKPDKNYKVVHVAGTNGKGSVATKVSQALIYNGYNVGTFTSPHISSFCERISVNNKHILYNEVEILLEQILEAAGNIKLSFFEVITLMALLYFEEKRVDYAVVEVGLGGRLDATNIIRPAVSVITSIGMDHVDILGNSLSSIAKEKAGIIKEGVPVVLGPTAQLPEILSRCRGTEIKVSVEFNNFDDENIAISKAVLEVLGESYEDLSIRPSCRFEVVCDDPIVILDVAHNTEGFNALFCMVKDKYPDRKISVAVAFSQGKNVDLCCNFENLYFIHNNHERIMKVEGSEDIFKALPKILSDVRRVGHILVICGSFFIMSDVRKILGIVEECDFYDLNERMNYV